jgi:DNA invertase Pin-like site-specific DNA recombinase
MQFADLYIRVSTDEQAGLGFSQRYQEEILRKYCQVNNIKVRKVIFEDYSAKNFNRPEWNRLMVLFKRKSERPDLILFTKWDRFSRNAGDAYYMVNQLQSMGIAVRAIEQPLDLSVPENKVMMALYLTIPEVENDRRSINVRQGMRRARKEGRWTGAAPIGYTNKSHPDGSKYIIPKEPQASFMRQVFEDLAEGKLNVRQIHKKATENGMQCSLANLWQVIRNPVYCGRVAIPKTEHESQQMVIGLHTPIISEQLFLRAQAFLDSRRTHRTKIQPAIHLPLRGYLNCPKCGKILSGSQSKGYSKHYLYYHCTSSCGYRARADMLNQKFEAVLTSLVLRQAYCQPLKEIVERAIKTTLQQRVDDTLKISQSIDRLIKRVDSAKELLLQGDLTGEDYKIIKVQCEAKISLLGSKMADLQAEKATIDKQVSEAYSSIEHLDTLYQSLPTPQKKELIEAMFITPIIFGRDQFQQLHLSVTAQDLYETSLPTADDTSNRTLDLLKKLAELSVETLLARRSKTDFTF